MRLYDERREGPLALAIVIVWFLVACAAVAWAYFF